MRVPALFRCLPRELCARDPRRRRQGSALRSRWCSSHVRGGGLRPAPPRSAAAGSGGLVHLPARVWLARDGWSSLKVPSRRDRARVLRVRPPVQDRQPCQSMYQGCARASRDSRSSASGNIRVDTDRCQHCSVLYQDPVACCGRGPRILRNPRYPSAYWSVPLPVIPPDPPATAQHPSADWPVSIRGPLGTPRQLLGSRDGSASAPDKCERDPSPARR